jgi:beta-glucosidase/6-phospho-beta-glucosidase/beta-galactosidase
LISCQYKVFGTNFAWGSATASYQVEGAYDTDGRGRSIWDDFSEKPGKVRNGDTGKVADDFYHRYKEDIATMKELGLKHFRMSISWSRIMPSGRPDYINQKGVDFYNSVIDTLL